MVTPSGGAAAALLGDLAAAIRLTPEVFGAVGNGVANDTTAITNWLNAGGGRVRDGAVYKINATEVVGGDIRIEGRATFLLRTAPSGSAAEACVLKFTGCDQVGISNGTKFDFNAAITFPALSGDTFDWAALILDDCENVKLDVETVGSPRWGVRLAGCRRTETTIYAHDCGGIAMIEEGAGPNAYHEGRWIGENLTNVYNGVTALGHHHLADLWELDNGKFDIVIRTATGSQPAGYSSFISGVTTVNCNDLDVNVSIEGMQSALNVLPVSIVSCSRSTIRPKIKCEFGLGLELCGDTSGLFIDHPYIDGLWRTAAIVQRVGISCKGQGLYPAPDRNRRPQGAGVANRISSGTVMRTHYACEVRTGNWEIDNLNCSGNFFNGYRFDNEDLRGGSYGGGAPETVPQNILLRGPRASFNGQAGIAIANGRGARIIDPICNNNGQDTTSGTVAVGIGFDSSDPNVDAFSDLAIGGFASLDDTQYVGTITAAVAFAPQTPSAIMPDTSFPYQVRVTRLSPNLAQIGQQLLFKAVASGSDVKAKVLDIDRDEMIVACPGNAAWTATGLTSNLSGTWSGSGTTLTGTGTNADGDIKGGDWVSPNGTDWRQVETVYSDTSMVISAAFPSALSGATLQVIRADVSDIPCQQYGFRGDNGLLTDVHLGAFIGRGNKVSPIYPYYANLRPGSVVDVANLSIPSFSGGSTTITGVPGIPLEWVVVGVSAKITTALDAGTGIDFYVYNSDGAANIGSAVMSLAAVTAGTSKSAAVPSSSDNPKVARTIRMTRTGGGTTSAGAVRVVARLALPGPEIPLAA